MAAVAASSTAMTAVAASSTAMAAVWASATARSAVTGSATGRNALKASPLVKEKTRLCTSQSQYWSGYGTFAFKGFLIATKCGNTDNAFTVRSVVDSKILTSDMQTRNAAVRGDTGYYDWLERNPNDSYVQEHITYWAYYTTTAVKYLPCA